MTEPAVLGVDCSTQATKVEVRSLRSGRLLGSGRAPHPPTHPPRSEQEPSAWWSALVEACTQVDCSGVRAVAVAGQQHGLVALDAAAEVIRPAKLWNDTESAADAGALVSSLGAAEWARACGSVPAASFTITKLAWLRRVEPRSFARLRTVLLPHDWVTHRLCGAFATDRGDASGTGFWSPVESRWRTDLLRLVDESLDWEEMLPPVWAASARVGAVTDAAARATGIPEGAVVAAGTGDNMAAAAGLGLEPGRLCMSIGTSGTVYALSPAPVCDSTGMVAGFAAAEDGWWLPLACTLNGTKVTDTVLRLLGRPPSALDRSCGPRRDGSLAPVLLPYLDGERTPNLPRARGLLWGLRSDSTAPDLVRAAVDGVVCGLLDGAGALAAAGVELGDGPIVLVGGGARSRAYRQAVADLSGRSVRVPAQREQVALGACVLAAACLDGADAPAVARRWRLDRGGTVVEADAAVDVAAVRAAYARVRDGAATLLRDDVGS